MTSGLPVDDDLLNRALERIFQARYPGRKVTVTHEPDEPPTDGLESQLDAGLSTSGAKRRNPGPKREED